VATLSPSRRDILLLLSKKGITSLKFENVHLRNSEKSKSHIREVEIAGLAKQRLLDTKSEIDHIAEVIRRRWVIERTFCWLRHIAAS
jgi:hypothetical protein